MSQTIQIDTDRLKEIIEFSVLKERAKNAANAPGIALYNCSVTIENGDSYEEDAAPAEAVTVSEEPVITRSDDPNKQFIKMRAEVLDLAIQVEGALQRGEQRSQLVMDAAAYDRALIAAFDYLQQKRKGDASVESVKAAYVALFAIAYKAAKDSGVLDNG